MFWTNSKIRKLAAKEIITEGFLWCETSKDYSYLCGLIDMAYELKAISKKERDTYLKAAEKIEP